jgi:hypothetical protein
MTRFSDAANSGEPCSHGVEWNSKDDCADCAIRWHEHQLKQAEKTVEAMTSALHHWRRRKQLSAAKELKGDANGE